ncbi:MAG: type IV secretion system DNA-binding domain-containing protein [Patescibacteria group bacterium]
MNIKPNICYFGTVRSQKNTKSFGILQEDRRKHMYVLGKTGMGKTTLLQNMILQDIYNGFGVCFIDPHGDSAEYILDRIPSHRQNDIVYFNPADTDFPIGLNMLESQRGEERFLIASGLIAIFHRLWSGMWSARMEYILNNTLLALLETPGNTLLSVIQMLTNIDYRKKVVSSITDPLVRNFWTKEFAGFNERYKQEAISPILNKIGQFLSNDLIRNIVGQKQSTFDFRGIIDNQKILIVNLSKGRLGEDNSNMLGSLIVNKLQLAALSRVDVREQQRNDFYLYVDEFQNFTTDSFATILSEARKYRLNLVLAHQYISQLSESGNEKIRNAIFGNIGTIVSFRVGSDDAQMLVKEFSPIFESEDFISLDRFKIALTLSINNKKSKGFLAETLAPIFDKMNGRLHINLQHSRQKYGIPKQQVAQQISQIMTSKLTSSITDLSEHDERANQTNHNLSENSRYSSSLAALKMSKKKIEAKEAPKLMVGSKQVEDINLEEEQLFGLPN